MSPKHGISARQPSKETIISSFFPRCSGIHIPENNHDAFPNECEGGEVSGMLARGFEYELDFFADAGGGFIG